MIEIEGYEYRNLQEQVAQNASDIADLDDGKQDKLTAGAGISIDPSSVISCSVSGGTKLYYHSCVFSGVSWNGNIAFVSTKGTACDTLAKIEAAMLSGFAGYIDGMNMNGQALMMGFVNYHDEGFGCIISDGFYLASPASPSVFSITATPFDATITDTITEL